MLDQGDVNIIGEEFERGLKAYHNTFSEKEMKALRTAFEMAMMNAFRMIDGRYERKR